MMQMMEQCRSIHANMDERQYCVRNSTDEDTITNPLDLSVEKSSLTNSEMSIGATYPYRQQSRKLGDSTRRTSFPYSVLNKPYSRFHMKKCTSLPKSPLATSVTPPRSSSLDKDDGDAIREKLYSKIKARTTAQNWINSHLVKKPGSFVIFWTILLAYNQFCVDLNVTPLNSDSLFKLIQQRVTDSEVFSQDDDDDDDDDEHLAKEIFFNLSFSKKGLLNDGKSTTRVKVTQADDQTGEKIHVAEDSYDSGISSGDSIGSCSDNDKDEIHSDDDMKVPDGSGTERVVPNGTLAKISSTEPKDEKAVNDEEPRLEIDLDRSIKVEESSAAIEEIQENRKEMILSKISALLSLDNGEFGSSPCLNEARQLSKLIVEMFSRNQLGAFLEVFGHSMSCRGQCPNRMCEMFRRLFVVHLSRRGRDGSENTGQGHVCSLKRIYEHLLRLHLDYCNRSDDQCGVPKCCALREKRRLARSNGSIQINAI